MAMNNCKQTGPMSSKSARCRGNKKMEKVKEIKQKEKGNDVANREEKKKRVLLISTLRTWGGTHSPPFSLPPLPCLTCMAVPRFLLFAQWMMLSIHDRNHDIHLIVVEE